MNKFILTLLSLLLIPSTLLAKESSATVNVNGLVCDFCARAVEKVFKKQEAIKDVKVDLDAKTIALQFKDSQNIDDKIITKLVTDAGYKVVSIIRAKDPE